MKSGRHHLAEVLGERTLHVSDTRDLAQEVAAYLLSENLTSELDSLMRDIMQYRADRGVVETTVVSAHKLSKQDLDDITELLHEEYPKATSFTIDQRLDPQVVGGVKIELPGEQLDLTVKDKLNAFKRLTATERTIA